MAYTPTPTYIPMFNITEVAMGDEAELKRQVQLNFEDIMAMISGVTTIATTTAGEEALAWAFFMDGEG